MQAPQEIRTFFVTTVTAGRRSLFQTDANCQILLDVLAEDQAKSRYQLHAFVIMRDHLHLLITPHHDLSLERAVQFIKEASLSVTNAPAACGSAALPSDA